MDTARQTDRMLNQALMPVRYVVLKAVNNWMVVVGLYVAAIAGSATVFAVVEERPFGDGLWWAFITGLTIGYGDVYPETLAGRIAGVVLAHVVILLIVPMIIAHMTLRLIVDHDEFTHLEQEEMKNELDEIRDNLRRLMERMDVAYVPRPVPESVSPRTGALDRGP